MIPLESMVDSAMKESGAGRYEELTCNIAPADRSDHVNFNRSISHL